MSQQTVETNVPCITLNNGVTIPQIGLGVWQAEDGTEAEQAVLSALDTGYRLIDTAAIYGNEKSVGLALRESALPREDIFITTKLWNADQGTETAVQAFETSLKKLGLEYVDLYLIHWPMPAKDRYIESWKTLQGLLEDGRARAIGVCNFEPEHLENLIAHTDVIPAVNQIELHPKLQQRDTRDYCASKGIKIESWSPLMQGGELLDDEQLMRIADKYHKTTAQVIIRWHIQHELIVIPKSVHEHRIRENFNVFDFELSESDMQTIDAMDAGERTGPDPKTANFS